MMVSGRDELLEEGSSKSPHFQMPMTPSEKHRLARSSLLTSTNSPAKQGASLHEDTTALANALASTLPPRTPAAANHRSNMPATPYAPATPLARMPFTPLLRTPRVAAPLLPCSQCTSAQDQIIALQSRLHTLDMDHLAAQEQVLQVQREKAEVEWERNNAVYEAEKAREEVVRLRAILEAKADDPHPDVLAAQQIENLQYKLYMEKLNAMLGEGDSEEQPDVLLDRLEQVLDKVRHVLPSTETDTLQPVSSFTSLFPLLRADVNTKSLLDQLDKVLTSLSAMQEKIKFSDKERLVWRDLVVQLASDLQKAQPSLQLADFAKYATA